MSIKIIIVFASNILIAGLNFIGFIMVARYLGPKSLGFISFSLSFIGLFQFLSDLGFNSAHIKRVSEGKDFAICNGTFISIKLVLTLILTGIVLFVVHFGKYNKAFLQNSQSSTVIYIFLIYVVCLSLGEISQATFQAKRESVRQQLPALFGNSCRLMCLTVFLILGFGVVAVSVSYAIGGIIIVLVSLILYRSLPVSKINWFFFKEYFSFAAPIALYTLTVNISANIDKILIGYSSGFLNVGLYYGGQQLTFALSTLIVAFAIILFPTFSSLYSLKNFEKLNSLLFQSERYVTMIFSPVVFFSILFADSIMLIIFGKQFLPAVNFFQLMLLVSLLTGMNVSYEQYMISTCYLKVNVKIAFINIILNISLCLILVPKQLFGVNLFGLGPLGAVIASTLSYFPRFLLVRYKVYKFTGANVNRRILMIIFSALMPGIILFAIYKVSFVVNFYSLIWLGGVYMVSYLTLLFFFKELTKQDISLLRNILKSSFLYIRV